MSENASDAVRTYAMAKMVFGGLGKWADKIDRAKNSWCGGCSMHAISGRSRPSALKSGVVTTTLHGIEERADSSPRRHRRRPQIDGGYGAPDDARAAIPEALAHRHPKRRNIDRRHLERQFRFVRRRKLAFDW